MFPNKKSVQKESIRMIFFLQGSVLSNVPMMGVPVPLQSSLVFVNINWHTAVSSTDTKIWESIGH